MQARRQFSQNSASPQGAQKQKGKKQEPPRFKSLQYNGVRGARECPTVFGAAVKARIEGYKRAERAAAVVAQTAGSGQV